MSFALNPSRFIPKPWKKNISKFTNQDALEIKYLRLSLYTLNSMIKKRGSLTMADFGLQVYWSFESSLAWIDDSDTRSQFRVEMPLSEFLSAKNWPRWKLAVVLIALDVGLQPLEKNQ